MTEYCWTTRYERAQVVILVDLPDEEEMASSLWETALTMFKVMVDQLYRLDSQIADPDQDIEIRAKAQEAARPLMTIPGIGPIAVTAILALAPPIEACAKGCHYLAWLGLTPRQRSTGGKQRLR